MAAQAGLCLAWSETPEDTFCHVVAHFIRTLCMYPEVSILSVSLSQYNTVNFLNIRTPKEFVVITLEVERDGVRVIHPKGAEGIANSVDPDQTAPRSGSALFAQTCLSENLGKLWYYQTKYHDTSRI